MKARMEVTLDTIWTNQVTASVECELDNPHVLTAQMLAEMMTHRLKFLVEEIRLANVRSVPELDTLAEPRRVLEERRAGGPVDSGSGTPERERQAYEEMRREKDDEHVLARREEGAG